MAQRRANLFENETDDMPDDGRFGGVGALLRRRREEIQQDIDDVSRQLRIRAIYIRAIEEGRFQELPGNAYAVGFVRAYADYLGLDGGSVVSDYRDELARRSRQNELVWPTEGSESRFPGGAILGVCVLLGLAIYGGWYYATQSGGTGITLIDQVPDYIKKATGVGGQTAENEAPAEPARTEAQAATSTTQPMAPADQAQPAADTAAPAAAEAPSAPPPPAVVLTPSADTPGAVTVEQGQSAATPDAPASETPATETPASDDAAAAGPAVAATQEAAAPTQPAPVPPAAKVVIRANRDSWIEIRDKNDAVVLQRVLRQGETFNVPDESGLVMTTGNAGGIVIELEGKPLQSLGSLGVVKRGIKLDPAALLDGSAFNVTDDQ